MAVGTAVCNDVRVDYDINRLVRLGKRRAKLLAETKENLRDIEAEILIARRARVTQDKIAQCANVSRVTVQKHEPKEETPDV